MILHVAGPLRPRLEVGLRIAAAESHWYSRLIRAQDVNRPNRIARGHRMLGCVSKGGLNTTRSPAWKGIDDHDGSRRYAANNNEKTNT